MQRSKQVALSGLVTFCLILVALCAGQSPAEQTALAAPGGELPVLVFVDEALIAKSEAVTRVVQQPQRTRSVPIISNPGYANTQWKSEVIRDPQPGIPFRLYYAKYNTVPQWIYQATAAYADSQDGITFGPATFVQPNDFWSANGILDDRTRSGLYFSTHWRDSEGMKVATSRDGKTWTIEPDIVIPAGRTDDIWNPFYCGLNGEYIVGYKSMESYTWTNAEGKSQTKDVRLVRARSSADFYHWPDSAALLFAPDNKDSGITQFYGGPAGVLQRGGLLLGFLKVLRDDVTVTGAPVGAYGQGYTVLAWSRDGETWQRDRMPFFEPSATAGTWDHAMAWVDDAEEVGDQVYLYYAGYKWGHKYNTDTERQIGEVTVPRDRYVARRTTTDGGYLNTTPFVFAGKGLTVNAQLNANGVLYVGVGDAGTGLALDGYKLGQCAPVHGDSLGAPISCQKPLADLQGREVFLRLWWSSGDVYAA